MKNSITTLLLFLLTLTVFSQDAEDVQIEIHKAYTDAVANDDYEAIADLYTTDATIMNIDGSVHSGNDNIKDVYKAFISQTPLNIELTNKSSEMLSEDVISSTDTFTLNFKDDSLDNIEGAVFNIYKKVDDNWKIHKSYRWIRPNPSNLETVNSMYENFAKGDVPAVLKMMDSNIEWNEAEGNSLADKNPYIGPDAVLNGVFARLGERHEYFKLKDIQLHEMSNNKVLATLRYDAKNKATGKEYDAQVAHLWTLQNGKVVAFQQYVDTKKLADAESE